MTNQLDSTRKVSNFKTKKLSSIIDFSALVSLSFLLIMFFMLTSAMSKPQKIELSLPEDYGCGRFSGNYGCMDENRSVTLLLGSNNQLIYYSGILFTPLENPISINYGKEGIRKKLISRKKAINEYSAAKGKINYDNMIVIIKPNKESNYKNLVDILDEMAIVGITTYSIVNDFSSEEKKLMSNK